MAYAPIPVGRQCAKTWTFPLRGPLGSAGESMLSSLQAAPSPVEWERVGYASYASERVKS